MLNEPPKDNKRSVHPLERSADDETIESPTPPEQPIDSNTVQQPKRRLHPLEQQAVDARNAANNPQQHPPQPSFTMEMPPPRLAYALIAINSLIFFVMFALMDIQQQNEVYDWGANNSRLVFDGEYHRLFTSMFLHGSVTHVVFNMLGVYYIGLTIERFFGVYRFALIYVLSGLAGSLLSVLLNGPDISSVGASGALFGLVGAEMVFLYKHRKLFRRMAQSRLRSLVIIVILNLAVGFGGSFVEAGVRIDNWGHIGGLVGGFILAWYLCPDLIPKRHPERPNAFLIVDMNPLEKNYQVIMLFISGLLGLLIFGTLMN